jgi:ankyrin repeat protein
MMRTPVLITAVEDEEDTGIPSTTAADDFIPGPPPETMPLPHTRRAVTTGSALSQSVPRHHHRHLLARVLGASSGKQQQPPPPSALHRRVQSHTALVDSHLPNILSNSDRGPSTRNLSNIATFHAFDTTANNNNNNNNTINTNKSNGTTYDVLQLSDTEHRWAGSGLLANRADLALLPNELAAGCQLLQASAQGNRIGMAALLARRPHHVNFRDYDRRTALHVAASEGHLSICKYLVEDCHAMINRSDRWGGSALDDAHRHRHRDVATYLRSKGGLTGSGNRAVNLITACAEGDLDEVRMLLAFEKSSHRGATNMASTNVTTVVTSNGTAAVAPIDLPEIDKGDYDKRTGLHLAAGEGHVEIVKELCAAGANVNVQDRWKRTPLDDAYDGQHQSCIEVLEQYGAKRGVRASAASMGSNHFAMEGSDVLDRSSQRVQDNMKIQFDELDMIDRIGAGAFGEIYKCRWRGTLVAAKIIKTARIRKEWVHRKVAQQLGKGLDVDDAIHEMDEAEMAENDKDLALADFRQEVSVLRGLRHPNIVLLLAYSTTENYEVMISELMKCSLLDVFKSHMVQGTRMPKHTQIIYALHLAQGMNYLHTCKPPIIHRDLKPANLLVDHSGNLKISDFGLSKVRPDPEKNETDKFTMTGETGSYRFMAPEVFRHENYDETVDVYSYAMILFYLLVGRPPWNNLAGMAAVKRAAYEGDRPDIPRDMDITLQTLLKECWDDSAKKRPPFSRILAIVQKYRADVLHDDSDYAIATVPPPRKLNWCCTVS